MVNTRCKNGSKMILCYYVIVLVMCRASALRYACFNLWLHASGSCFKWCACWEHVTMCLMGGGCLNWGGVLVGSIGMRGVVFNGVCKLGGLVLYMARRVAARSGNVERRAGSGTCNHHRCRRRQAAKHRAAILHISMNHTIIHSDATDHCFRRSY